MAELNFGLLNPPGSQSIGNAFVQGMDQAAAARAQENQNALAQYTLSKAKREDELNTQLLGDLRNATTNDEIYRAYQRAGKGDVASRLRGEGLTQDKTRLEIAGLPLTQAKTKADTAILHGNIMEREANAVVANPTSARAMQAVVNFGKATGQDVTQELKTLTELGDDPNKIAAWARGHALKGKDLAAFSTPKPTPTNVGNKIVFLDMNPNSPTFKSEVIPSQNIGVSPNTQATLAQAQQHFNGLSAYQKEQLRVQGKQFDSDRGVIVDVKNGTFEPVYSYPSSTPAAPDAIPTAPSAAPAGTPPLQLNVTPGMAPSSASNMQIPQAIAGARVPQALQKVMDNDKLAILLKERENQVFLGRLDPALDREIANLQGRPTSVASQTVTQPAQRTVLGPKPEKPPTEYFKEVKGIINTNYAINNLKTITDNFTAADMLNPARRAEIESAHSTAVLLAKDMFGLGVLNEGDERILRKIIPDPTAFSKGLVPIETIRKNLVSATNVIKRMNETTAKVHKQPLLILDAETPRAPSPSAPPIESFRPSQGNP